MQGMFSYQGRCIISALLGALIGAVFGIFSLYHGGVLFTVPAGIFAGLFSANAVTIARSILRGALVAAVVQLLILIAFDAAGMASSSGSEFVMEQLLWVACGLSLGSIVGIVTWTFPKWIAWVVMFACGGLFFSSEYQYQRNLSVNALFVPVQICAEVANGEIIRLLLWNGAEMNDSDWFGNTPMHWAASSGKQDIIQLLLAQRASVNPLNHFNNTPLHFAVQRGRKEIVQLLLDSGATANVSNYAGNTPLHLAARRNFAEIAETLIKAQANIHAKNRNGKTPIDLAAVAGNRQLSQFFETGRLPRQSRVPGAEETIWERQEDLIEKLQQQEALILKQRPDLEPLFKHLTAEQAKGGSMTLSEIEAQEVGEAFCIIAKKGDAQAVRLFLQAGISPNTRNGFSAECSLTCAAEKGRIEIMKILVENNRDLFGRTPSLQQCVKDHSPDCVQLILKAGVDLKSRDCIYDFTTAAAHGDREIVQAFVKAGMDVNAIGWDQMSALMAAAIAGQIPMMQFLLESGAKVDAKNQRGDTALHDVFYYSNEYAAPENAVQWLIAKGANINAQDRDGITPLMFAARIGETQGARMLISAGAEINAKDRRGETALAYARKNGYSSDSEICKVISDAGGMDSSSH